MHVGVFLSRQIRQYHPLSLPHARGGVSTQPSLLVVPSGSSPCTWGCFQAKQTLLHTARVFPMHVGVFPLPDQQLHPSVCLPHARGGVSIAPDTPVPPVESSPCTWGCFYSEQDQ